MDSTQMKQGQWRGTCAEEASKFERFTILDISYDSGKWWGKYITRKADLQPFELTWNEQSFYGETTNWIAGTVITVEGTFSDDGSCLEVQFKGEGLTGLEDYKVNLYKTGYEEYYSPSKYVKYTYKSPELGVFPIGTLDPSLGENIVNDFFKLNGSFDQLKVPRFDAINIIQNGKIVLEEYFWGMNRQRHHITSSCTKSITSILLCIAIDLGLADLDHKIADFLVPIKEDSTTSSETSWKDPPSILVKHVVSMTTGTTAQSPLQLLTSEDIVQLGLSAPRTSEPGTVYNYDNTLPVLIGLYIEKVSGMGFEAFAKKYLFEPLEIVSYKWTYNRQLSVDGSKSVMSSGGIRLTMNDFCKFGVMMLDGTYKNKRIISEEMAAKSHTQFTPKGKYPYGMYWHLNEGRYKEPGFSALGQGEQVLTIFPEKNLVVGVFSSSWYDTEGKNVVGVLDKYISEF